MVGVCSIFQERVNGLQLVRHAKAEGHKKHSKSKRVSTVSGCVSLLKPPIFHLYILFFPTLLYGMQPPPLAICSALVGTPVRTSILTANDKECPSHRADCRVGCCPANTAIPREHAMAAMASFFPPRRRHRRKINTTITSTSTIKMGDSNARCA